MKKNITEKELTLELSGMEAREGLDKLFSDEELIELWIDEDSPGFDWGLPDKYVLEVIVRRKRLEP